MRSVWLKNGLLLMLFAMGLFSCDTSRVFEQNADLKDKNWYIDSVQTFSFVVADASHPYNLLINIRNSEIYPFYNLFLRYTLQDSSKKELKSQQLELILMDPTTGKPQGKGLGDIYNHQFGLLSRYQFPASGTYTLQLKQYMRQDPLPEVYSVGLRVEKFEEKKK